jgi:hypothetical protein
MKHFIADDAAIAQTDGRQTFGGQRLVPQATKRLRALWGAIRIVLTSGWTKR